MDSADEYDTKEPRLRSIVIGFRPPAGRCLSPKPLCNQYGSVVDLSINGIRCFFEDSPLIVQPDLLVDTATGGIVGLTFELTSPDWELERCKQMLEGLDPRTIRISEIDTNQGRPIVPAIYPVPEIYLDVLWGDSDAYEHKFAQADFGLWAFLYNTPNPNLLHQGDEWTQPEALLFADVERIPYPLAFGETGYEEMSVETVGEVG